MDRRRSFDWADFDGRSAVRGLQGLSLEAVGAELRRIAADETAAVLRGDLQLLGQSWPRQSGPWWDGDLWRTDPQTGRPWPGFGGFAFDAPYRGMTSEVKFLWELNRLPMLPVLALNAAATGAPSPVFVLLRGWMAANPPFRGVNWCSGVEGAHRVVALLAALSLTGPETAEDRAAVHRFLAAHAFWIGRYPSRFSSANNHRVAELCALYLIGLSAPKMISASKLAPLQRRLEREIGRQFHEDGIGSEQSTAYAALSLEWFTLAAMQGEAAGRPFSPAFKRRAARAADALAWLLDTGGLTPRIGDVDESRVLPLRLAPEPHYIASVVALTRRWLGRPQPILRNPSLRDVIGVQTSPATPPVGVRTFPKGGLSAWRIARSDGDLLLAFDHGPLGHGAIAAHGHADALSVWLHWRDEGVVVDAGSHLYHGGGALRNVMRGTGAHNTLTVEGEDQSRIIGPFAWSQHARAGRLRSDGDGIEAIHNGYRRRFGVRHRRRVDATADTILIEDWLDGWRDRAWMLGFTLAPNIAAEVYGAKAWLVTAAGRRCVLTAEEGGAWDLVEAPYSPEFGVLQRTSRLQLSGRGRGLVSRVRAGFHQHNPT